MTFSHCPHCGRGLISREIGDEGLVPYCPACQVPLWAIPTTCVICAVVNEQGEIALLRQDYVSHTKFVCVAGVLKLGESAEDGAAREIQEEIGLQPEELRYLRSYPYPQKEMLMLGFLARVKKKALTLSREVDSAQWIPLHQAPGLLNQGGIAWQLVQEVIRQEGQWS